MVNHQEKALFCNGCGRELKKKNGIYRAENHSLTLCEACYDKLAGLLAIPPEVTEETELLSIG